MRNKKSQICQMGGEGKCKQRQQTRRRKAASQYAGSPLGSSNTDAVYSHQTRLCESNGCTPCCDTQTTMAIHARRVVYQRRCPSCTPAINNTITTKPTPAAGDSTTSENWTYEGLHDAHIRRQRASVVTVALLTPRSHVCTPWTLTTMAQ